MTETMSHLPENLITPHLTGASWNPAMRPEDAPDASVAAESTSRPAMERPSQTDEISAENTAKEDIVSKPVTQSTDEPNVATVSSGGHNEFPPSTSGPTEEGKPSNINWGEETDASWDFQSQNPFERVDVAARTNSFPAVESATEPADEEIITEQQPNAPQSYDESRTSQHEDLHLSSQLDASQNDNNNFWEADAAEDDEGEFFDQLKTQTKPIYVPPEAESRFEEGIPLVEIEVDSQPGDANKDEPQLDDVFGEDDADDFFASTATKDASAAERPTVIRKSTYDVLGALDSGVPDSPVGDSPAAFELKTEDDDLAARWQAELDDVEGSPDVPEPKAEEEDLAARWQAELDDDDDGLLLEDNVLDETKGQPQEEPTFLNGDAAGDLWSQRAPQLPSNYTNPYAPHQPSSSELVQGLPNLYAPTSGVPQTQPESDTSAPHSFVDQAKDGYKSPYDLPESLAPRPRRAVAARKTAPPSSTGMPPPPARSSSIPSSTSTPAVSSIFPQSEAQNDAPQQAIGAAPVAKNFFEELPAPAPRQRPGSRTGMYNPPASAVSSAPVPSESMLPPAVPPPFLPPSQVGPEVAYQNQLQAPERIGPYANLTVPTASTGPGIGPRYSPKPPSTSSKSPLSSRYSPAPPSSQPPSTVRNRYVSQPNNLPFQPRTSSPLAHHEKIAYEAQQPQQRPSTSSGPASLSYPISSNHTRGSFSVPTTELAGDAASQLPPHSQAPVHPFNLPANSYAPSVTSEPPRRPSTESPYLPNAGIAQPSVLPPPTNDRGFAPPRRSQTQSPGRQSFRPHFVRNPTEPVHRPASVHEPSSPTKAVHAYAIPQVTSSVRNVPELDFILPTDGRELDPLQRWKGAPVFKFAFGGLVSSCFPQHIPRYTAGQMNPMIQPAPGEAKVRQFKQILPSDGDIVRYPGPLRTKSKKKDVVAWLSSRIAALENEGVPPSLSREPDAFKRHDERILLWKLLRILVENDGTLEGTSEIEKSIRNVISPELGLTDQDNVYDSGAPSGLYPPTDGSISPEPVASKVLGQVKTELLGGNREKAVWLAVDNRLWGHAMVISSTLDKALWKQVVQEFVRREVRSAGENIESLAALYAIISGNTEESIDELVPPSARLGLQMISKEGQGINKNAVDGLERWRETLGLIINNRSPDDHQALVSLGQLLASYGRTEASHICYMFAKAFSQRSIFGGADDPQAAIVLLGSDHLKFPTTFFRDEDAIALTEVFEFATSVLAGNTAAVLPYLQPYKLQHAYILADKGLKSEAMQYCEAISSVLKASTKPSPYYHQRLFAEIDELATRLKQAPSDGASSWMSKPSMEKVSGSMWAKFSSFVAGDESEAATNGSAMDADVGPFAKVTEAATISRPPSVSEVYGSYPMAQTASNAFSRYAPANQFAPSSSPEQHRARSSMESQRSPPIGVPYSARRGSQEPATPVESNPYNFGSSNTYGSPTSFPYHSTPPQSSYVPLAPVEEDLATQAQQSYTAAPQQSALTSGLQASPERFGQPLHEVQETQAPAEMPHYGGYDPPVMSSYEPPSYQPDLGLSTDGPGQEEEPDEPEEKPKKKSFMDDEDEDDLAARAASIQKAEKARRDREADEAVRRAAEADAQRPGPAKKGWFGGWWGGKKEGESSGGPIRAKLGEENSFYYDTELKKWVNKKDPNSATASARATPPPPKGPGLQSRSVSVGSTSSAGRPPTLQRPQSVSLLGTTPDSRPSTGTGASPLATSPAFGPPNGLPPRSVSTTAATVSTPPLPPGAGGGPPPPRPSTTSLSNASSIDDLLGAPTARKGGTVKSKKKGRGYIDVMAK